MNRITKSPAQMRRIITSTIAKRRFSTREAAARIGVTPQTISLWKRGAVCPSARNALAAAKALRIFSSVSK